MSCELLVPEIFNAAKLYFDVLLADGLPLSRVKELRLRPYVVRFQRMINGKRKSLYKWKPELVETIRTAIQRPDPPKMEEAFHELEIPARTESQQKANAKVTSEVSITPPIDSSFLEGSSSLFSTSYNERAEESETFNAICYGECSFPDFKRRIMLINGYYKRLTSTGMTIDELWRFDLYGMLFPSLESLKSEVLVLKPISALFIRKLIEKHCPKKIHSEVNHENFDLTMDSAYKRLCLEEKSELPEALINIGFKLRDGEIVLNSTEVSKLERLLSVQANETNKQHGHQGCYLLQLAADKCTDCYKIGRSANLLKRLNSVEYRNACIYCAIHVRDEVACERKLLKVFNEKFPIVNNDDETYGREKFQGNIHDIMKEFMSICWEYVS